MIERCRQDSKHCPTIIKCGTPSAITIPIGTVPGTTFTLSSLTLDTSGLCNPIIKLQFASNITLTEVEEDSLVLSFQINKICDNMIQRIPVGPQWRYANILDAISSETFSFFICDCDCNTKGCCIYTVEVTVVSATSGGIISNAGLSTIVTCDTQCC